MATEPVQGTAPVQDDEPTIGRLVTDASRDISTLISKEIQLAKSELKVSVKAGGMGLGLFAAAAFVAVLAIIMLSMAIVYLIHWNGAGLDLHWAYLIVFGLYLLVAGLLGFVGYRKVGKVRPPDKAINQGKEIPKALKGQA
jgi:Putative Actinobacterial Holin-X, holin superfamily III